MKNRIPIVTTCLFGAGLLAVTPFVSIGQGTLAAELPTEPAHATHVAASQAGGQTVDARMDEMLVRIQQLEATQRKPGQSVPVGTMPTGASGLPRMRPIDGAGAGARQAPADMAGMDMSSNNQGGMGGSAALVDQLAELRSKMQRLEVTIQQQSGSMSGATPMSGAAGVGVSAEPMQRKMAGMGGTGNSPSSGAPGAVAQAGSMAGMSGDTPAPGGVMGMMATMMDKMVSMMDKMMGGMGGAMPAGGASGGMGGGGMGMMDDDMMEMAAMGSGGAMPSTAPATGMSGGGGMGMMDDDMIEMAGMMGMGGMGSGAAGAMSQSAMPGFPGASHLYHIGATGFFLDHPQHIALTTEQQAALNSAKEQALLAKSTADRAVEQAEQDLWTLTAADQPDATKIEAKLAEIGKLTADKRLAFIRAVGDASKLLTDEQRNSLTGFAPPAPAMSAPAPAASATPMPMSDM